MIYTNPQPTGKTLTRYYTTALRYGEFNENYSETQLNFIEKYSKKDFNSIFDIGAYNGAFLNLAKKRGYKTGGIEPSKEETRNAWSKYRINLYNGFFTNKFAASLNKKFDVVTINHVLEHVQDPMEFIQNAINITRSNKYIFIDVPNSAHPTVNNIADFFGNEHIMHFTVGSLLNLAYKNGLSVIKIEQSKGPLSVIRMLVQNNIECEKPINRLKPIYNCYQTNMHILRKYNEMKKSFYVSIKSKFKNIKKLIIYGAGMHTTQLLQTGLLNNISIDCIVDSNPKKHGTRFAGMRIKPPSALKNKNYPVLISSNDSQDDISAFLSKHFPHLLQIKLYSHSRFAGFGANK